MENEVFIKSNDNTNREAIEKTLNETRELLRDNTNKIIERENYLNDIEGKTEYLSFNSGLFKKNTRKFKTKMWIQKHSCFIIGLVITLFIIILIIVLSYKGQNNH